MNPIIGLLIAASAAGMPPTRAPDFAPESARVAAAPGAPAQRSMRVPLGGPGESAASLPRLLPLAIRGAQHASGSTSSADSAQSASGALPPDWDDISWDGFDACGNGVVDLPDEECDRSDFGGATCELLGFAGGTLGCSRHCAIQTLQCSLPVSSCSIATCSSDADCGTGCGPCVQVEGWPGYCQGASGGGGQ